MKIAIVGSRDYPDLQAVWDYVESLPLDTVIVSGGARGVDSIAEDCAFARGMDTLIFPAEWDKYGKSAGFRRNERIVAECDRLVAFWDGTSRGTQHSIELARKAGKLVTVITPEGRQS